jgi:hypothetical protein
MYVMGEEATERAATDDEIAAMRAIVAEGLRAGAIGFATSWSPTHVGYAGRPVPSRVAELKEIDALADTLAQVSHGVMQATLGPGLFLDQFADINRRTGKPISWTALLGGMLGPDGHKYILERSAAMQAEGINVVPQVSCRPLNFEFSGRRRSRSRAARCSSRCRRPTSRARCASTPIRSSAGRCANASTTPAPSASPVRCARW